ncbi:hypothetical protein KY290_007366 [Solanum tuberosum]|uniref:Aspartate/glutamate/uridylate kinase domain-containing protein n=1 Tax=Solanum tuberosum TaxID=4113 RepID=A0ABQ7W5V1_SOLTU|nr:hypothetical protein KY290_007366 [Solanum tuberosum]
MQDFSINYVSCLWIVDQFIHLRRSLIELNYLSVDLTWRIPSFKIQHITKHFQAASGVDHLPIPEVENLILSDNVYSSDLSCPTYFDDIFWTCSPKRLAVRQCDRRFRKFQTVIGDYLSNVLGKRKCWQLTRVLLKTYIQLGFVGDIASVDPSVLRPLIDNYHIPVIASVAADKRGQSYNINADTAAGELAAALGAEKLLLLTDVAGILEDRNDPGSLVKQIDIKGVKKMTDDGKIAGGMIPKVNCCARSLAQGVKTASIIDGRLQHVVRIVFSRYLEQNFEELGKTQ